MNTVDTVNTKAGTIIEQLEGEPDKWHDRLARYVQQGSQRSFLSVYNDVLAEQDRAARKSLPGNWVTATRKYRWVERASLHDRSERMADGAAISERREMIREKRLGALEAHLDKTIQAIEALEPGDADYRSVAHSLGIVCRELRSELEQDGAFDLMGLLESLPSGLRLEIVTALRLTQEG